MPPPPRHTGRTSTPGRPSTSTPMSERQQMALLMQMTSTNEAGKTFLMPSYGALINISRRTKPQQSKWKTERSK